MKFKIAIGVIAFLLVSWLSQYIYSLHVKIDAQKDKITYYKSELSRANATIKHLNDESIRINKLNDANSRKIQALINQSTKTQEQLKDAIEKNQCADVALPTDVINILRNRADSINSATDTSKSNSASNGPESK